MQLGRSVRDVREMIDKFENFLSTPVYQNCNTHDDGRGFKNHVDIVHTVVSMKECVQHLSSYETKNDKAILTVMNELGFRSKLLPSDEGYITDWHGLSELFIPAKPRLKHSFRQIIKTEASKRRPTSHCSEVTMFSVPLMKRCNENNRTQPSVYSVPDSNGYISSKSWKSNASTDSLITSDEESIVYENDLSERADREFEGALCSCSACKKNNGNYKCTTNTRLERTRSGKQQYAYNAKDLKGVSSLNSKTSEMASIEDHKSVNISPGRRKLHKMNRNFNGRVVKRRAKSSMCPGYYRLMINFNNPVQDRYHANPVQDRYHAIVKPQLLQVEEEDRESDSTGFISVKSCNSKDFNITYDTLACVNKQDDTDGFDSLDTGNPEKERNENTRNQGMSFVEMQGTNSLQCLTEPKTKVEQWLKGVTSVTNRTESSNKHKIERAKNHKQNNIDEDLGSEEPNHMNNDTNIHLSNKQAVLSGAFVGEHAAKNCAMAGGTTFDDNIGVFDENISARNSHSLNEIENNLMKIEPLPELFIGNKHHINKSHTCDLMSSCAETFEREKGQLSDQISQSPPLPDRYHRDVYVVI